MNNQELELKIKELLDIENFFDMIIAVKEFEKDYKGSSFYKDTKMPLIEVIKNAKGWYMFQFDNIVTKLQSAVNHIDLTHLNDLMEQIGTTFQTENKETFDLINNFKDLVK